MRMAFKIYRFRQFLLFLVLDPWFDVHSYFYSVNLNVGLLSLLVDEKILRIWTVFTLPPTAPESLIEKRGLAQALESEQWKRETV